MKYVLHRYNVVRGPVLNEWALSPFDLYLLCGIVREIGRDVWLQCVDGENLPYC